MKMKQLDITLLEIMENNLENLKYKYDKENKPGISNLITIYSSLTNMSINEVEEKFKNSNYGEFKKEVADIVINVIEPIQNRYNEIINSSLIDEILDNGAKITNEIAEKKYLKLKQVIGLSR